MNQQISKSLNVIYPGGWKVGASDWKTGYYYSISDGESGKRWRKCNILMKNTDITGLPTSMKPDINKDQELTV